MTICRGSLLPPHLLLHQRSAKEEIEELIIAAELDICFEHHRIPGLDQRVQELMDGDALPRLVALIKIVALEHARHRVSAGEGDFIPRRACRQTTRS